MRYSPRKKGGPVDFENPRGSADAAGPLYDLLEPVTRGLGLDLVELTVSRHKRAVQVRAVVYKNGPLGVDDCSRAHHALLPRLELAFSDQDLYVEVSSPGIDRLIKDGVEFAFYLGRGVRCYRTDISDWSAGILESAGEEGIVLRGKEGDIPVKYEIIAKAKLDSSLE
ncbi:MAG: ribosome assembly cofactor RimP [Treponema sp.]|jgi:ribosome maturation factor RimP|nr:ribosome assembly cofactor RimP [Treponema sp.]